MNQAQVIEIIENDDAWDNGELGRDENTVRTIKLTREQQQTIDDAIGLQMISIRLPKSLIDEFKFLGDVHGLKYQTLMRQVLTRFADAETKNMASKAAKAQIKATRQAADDNRKQQKIA